MFCDFKPVHHFFFGWQTRISFRIQIVPIQANTVFIFRLKVDRPAVGAPLPSHQARIKILRDRLDLLCR